jgi:hypothetical protein
MEKRTICFRLGLRILRAGSRVAMDASPEGARTPLL